jgi:hypothetical protein
MDPRVGSHGQRRNEVDRSTGPADSPVPIASFRCKLWSGRQPATSVGWPITAAHALRVSNPALLPDLIEFLRSRIDVVAEPVSDDEVEVSLLGSYNADAMRMEL